MWPVRTLPMSRGRNGARRRIMAQRGQAHGEQVVGARVAFEEAGAASGSGRGFRRCWAGRPA